MDDRNKRLMMGEGSSCEKVFVKSRPPVPLKHVPNKEYKLFVSVMVFQCYLLYIRCHSSLISDHPIVVSALHSSMGWWWLVLGRWPRWWTLVSVQCTLILSIRLFPPNVVQVMYVQPTQACTEWTFSYLFCTFSVSPFAIIWKCVPGQLTDYWPYSTVQQPSLNN